MSCSKIQMLDPASVDEILAAYGLELIKISPGANIPASYWGEPEAGLAGRCLFAREDTPSHSLLHEMAHYICMTDERRKNLWRDARGNTEEENSVCFLQVILADYLPGLGRFRILADMEDWGYTFREGTAAAWFVGDGRSAHDWLMGADIINEVGHPTWRLRTSSSSWT